MLNVLGSWAKYFSNNSFAFVFMLSIYALQTTSIGSNLNKYLVHCSLVVSSLETILVTNSNGFGKVLVIKIIFLTPVSTTYMEYNDIDKCKCYLKGNNFINVSQYDKYTWNFREGNGISRSVLSSLISFSKAIDMSSSISSIDLSISFLWSTFIDVSDSLKWKNKNIYIYN